MQIMEWQTKFKEDNIWKNQNKNWSHPINFVFSMSFLQEHVPLRQKLLHLCVPRKPIGNANMISIILDHLSLPSLMASDFSLKICQNHSQKLHSMDWIVGVKFNPLIYPKICKVKLVHTSVTRLSHNNGVFSLPIYIFLLSWQETKEANS